MHLFLGPSAHKEVSHSLDPFEVLPYFIFEKCPVNVD